MSIISSVCLVANVSKRCGPKALIPLHAAARLGSVEILELLLGTESRCINVGDADQETALHKAVMNNHHTCVRLLLQQ